MKEKPHCVSWCPLTLFWISASDAECRQMWVLTIVAITQQLMQGSRATELAFHSQASLLLIPLRHSRGWGCTDAPVGVPDWQHWLLQYTLIALISPLPQPCPGKQQLPVCWCQESGSVPPYKPTATVSIFWNYDRIIPLVPSPRAQK